MNLMSEDKPAISVHALESCGKTRFSATAPGPIGLLAIDRKSKATFHNIATQLGTDYIVNEKPFMTDKEAIRMAILDSNDPKQLAEIKAMYTEVVERIMTTAMKFADHPDIRTIVMDTASQFFDFLLFSHFGRRNQIKPTSRGAVNQDMIDAVNALRSKNLILIHRSKELWKSTGQYDKQGEAIKEPSGKYESDGFRGIGGFVTVVLELTSKKVKTEDLSAKFRCKVVTSQSNVLLEGCDLHDFGVSGEGITWQNVLTVLGLEEE